MTRAKDDSENIRFIKVRQSLIFLCKERDLTIYDALVAASLLAQKRPEKGDVVWPTMRYIAESDFAGLMSTSTVGNSITRLISTGLITLIPRTRDNNQYNIAPLEEALARVVVPKWEPKPRPRGQLPAAALPRGKKMHDFNLERSNGAVHDAIAIHREVPPMFCHLTSSHGLSTWHRCEKGWVETKLDLPPDSTHFDIDFNKTMRNEKWCLGGLFPDSVPLPFVDGRTFQKLNGQWFQL